MLQKCQLQTLTLIMKLTDPDFKTAITKVGEFIVAPVIDRTKFFCRYFIFCKKVTF